MDWKNVKPEDFVVNKGDVQASDGATTVSGKGVDLYRLLALRGMLRLETKGMKSSKGSAFKTLKGMGIVTARTRKEGLEQVNAFISEVEKLNGVGR